MLAQTLFSWHNEKHKLNGARQHTMPSRTAIEIRKEAVSDCKNSELESRFNVLVKTWQQETSGCSLTVRRYAHGAYQSILALGPMVVPLILRELQERPDWWFEALKALTNKDPTKPTDNFHNAVKAWIGWGKEHKLIE